jgi:hypothetical protein
MDSEERGRAGEGYDGGTGGGCVLAMAVARRNSEATKLVEPRSGLGSWANESGL